MSHQLWPMLVGMVQHREAKEVLLDCAPPELLSATGSRQDHLANLDQTKQGNERKEAPGEKSDGEQGVTMC